MAGHECHATNHCTRGRPFTARRYSRGHTRRCDGGVEGPASSSPSVMRLPVERAVDPEEAFVASLCRCHMLWFLDPVAGGGWSVDDYRDDAVGVMGRNAAGGIAKLRVTPRPRVSFPGERRVSTDVRVGQWADA